MKGKIFIASSVLLLSILNANAENIELGAKQKPNISSVATSMRYEISEVAEKVRPYVVSIRTEAEIKNGFRHPLEEFFRIPPSNRNAEPSIRESLGSGVIISEQGYIITNNHVVEGATQIKVSLFDEREFEAEIVGLDEKSDIAVIKIKEKIKSLPTAYLGDSDALRIGEKVIAIGSPFGLNHTVTTGIVSAKNIRGRGITQYEDFIQTDAAINPGNSGGALINLEGELVGINSAILSKSGGFNGIGFAIPINMAKSVALDLINEGVVTRGWLGVSIQPIDESLAKSLKLKSQNGALISQVVKDTPAEKAGLLPGDVIVEVASKEIKNVDNLKMEVAQLKPGQKVKVKVIRNGAQKTYEVLIGSQDNPNSFSRSNAKNDYTQKLGFNLFEKEGLIIQSIIPNSKADRVGLRVGDKIQKVNGEIVKKLVEFKKIIDNNPEMILLYISREDREYFVALELN